MSTMTGEEFYRAMFDDFDKQVEKPLPEREQVTLAAVRAGAFMPITWCPVDIPNVGARLWVASDALAVGVPGDYLRVNVSARTQQLIADELGVTLPTSRIADLIHIRAQVKIPACTQPADPTDRATKMHAECALPPYLDFKSVQLHPMDSAAAGCYHSARVQAQLEAALGMCLKGQPDELCSTCGKHWGLSNKCTPSVAANVGWYDTRAPSVSPCGLHLYQPMSTRHNPDHDDYSQTDTAIYPIVQTSDGPVLLAEIQQDPARCKWVSYDGLINVIRQPGVYREVAARIAPAPFDIDDDTMQRLVEQLQEMGG
jgi:hypothetical protein